MNRFFAISLLAFTLFSHSAHAENVDEMLITELAQAGLEIMPVDGVLQPEPDGNHGSDPVNDIAAALLEITFWQSVEYSVDPAELEVYLRQYPNGVYVELARSKLANPGNFKDDFEFHGIDPGEMLETYEDPVSSYMLMLVAGFVIFGAIAGAGLVVMLNRHYDRILAFMEKKDS